MIHSRRRTLIIIAGVAILALAAGLGAGQFIRSPADAASRAEAPDASAITVPVELRVLETQVVTRGDAAFAGATEVELELGELPTAAVVTGQVPERGDELIEGEPLLEVVGRPVIALSGELPMYRSMRPGMRGPDVVQLKETLRRLGLSPGADDDRYTAATGQAVAALFERAGYEPPAPDEEVAAELAGARDAVSAAQDNLAAAEQALRSAGAGPSESERVGAQSRVDQAKLALEAARAGGDRAEIVAAEAELAMAEADQRDLLAAPDTSAERSARDAARSELTAAQRELSEVQSRAGTPLPASEVHYLPSLPRRVDAVAVSRGDLAQGVVMSVSGADLEITVQVNDADRQVLSEQMTALLDLPTGEATGTITEIRAATGEDARGHEVVITPDDLTPEEEDEVRSRNIRVTIPVSSTEGEVLAVPLAALSAGPSGSSRVEVQRDGGDGTELVEVTVGLVAQGYAEVTATGGSLAAGDLVVVGASAASDGADSDGPGGSGPAGDADDEADDGADEE